MPDPALGAVQRALERRDLRVAAAVLGPGPRPPGLLDRDVHSVALLELPPRLEGLGEEHSRVDRDDARVRVDLEQHVEQDALLLLERAERDEPVAVALYGLPDRLL